MDPSSDPTARSGAARVASASAQRAPRGLCARLASAAALVAWVAALAWWIERAYAYGAAPGARAPAVARLPSDAALALDPERPTLVVAAHPHCPCTRATLAQLERLAARCDAELRAHVLFYSDPALGPGWARSALWERVAAVPGARPIEDELGRLATQLGARTSGHAFLFAPDGRLLFEGGLTAGRGHEGDSAGADAVLALWRGERAACTSAPVFGCPIVEPGTGGRGSAEGA